MQTIIVRKGGPGSGYEDHPGRPGEVGGSVARSNARLADEVPIRPISIDRVMEMHPKWSRDQAQEYIDKLPRPDTSKIIIVDKERSRFVARVQHGREMIRRVHKEITGVQVYYRSNSQMQDALIPIGSSANGVYSGRRIFLSETGSAETYVHEYGHYLDSLLGTKLGIKFFSETEPILSHITAKEDLWVNRESFAEFYSAWITNLGNVENTFNHLETKVGWHASYDKDLVEAWDRLLRSELDMVI